MEITWFGLSCFRLRVRGMTVIADPFSESVGLSVPRLRANVVTISHHAPGHNNHSAVKGFEHIFDGPGEYEVSGVFITGVTTYHKGPVGKREHTTAFLYDFDEISVVHLGDVGTLPGREQVELLSGPDILLLPVGGGDSLDAAKAVEMVTELEPSIVIPMHYAMPGLKFALDPVEKFLKEMGVPAPEPVDSLKVTRSHLNAEETQVVLLEPQGGAG